MQLIALFILFHIVVRLALSPKQIACDAFAVIDRRLSSHVPSRTQRFAPHHENQELAAQRGNEDGLDDEADDDDDEISLGDKDWRAFRAKLVLSDSPQSKENDDVSSLSDESDVDGIGALFSAVTGKGEFRLTPLDPSQWAYESGKVIEEGAIILGGVEQEYGFGLRQQYFHKAAILVLDHDEKQFTKGIILNRPTDLTLDDDINEGVKWRVWFGGDVQGLNSNSPDIVCLHSLKNDQVMRASMTVMNDIQWTTFENAKRLVKVGVARPTEFWVFCGYAGWGPQQLMGELDRKSWYMVATDSQTLLKELARLSAGADPRDAGLDTWDLLMNMIGRKETARKYSGGFDDLMLKEWARHHLLSIEAGGGGAIIRNNPPKGASSYLVSNSIDDFLDSARTAGVYPSVAAGCIVRASSAKRSPFLLDDQELHKSIILVTSDDENLTVGVVLNRPAAKGIDINIKDKTTGLSRTEVIPLRYGGQYAVRGAEPLLWLHCDNTLKSCGIGHEIGQGNNGIYKCTAEDVSLAIGKGLARPEDFVVVSGVSVWNKGSLGSAMHGFQDEVQMGKFEVIPPSRTVEVWRMLLLQDVLSKANLVQNLAIAGKAWSRGSGAYFHDSREEIAVTGLGENFEEEDDALVFKSNVKVSDLSDKALRSWVATFLLGLPSHGESSPDP